MAEQPNVNDYLNLIRDRLARSLERTRRAFEEELNAASRTGLGGNTIRRVLDRVQQEFESGVSTVLTNLKQICETSNLTLPDLRGVTAQELDNFLRQMKSTVVAERLGVQSGSPQTRIIEQELANLDHHLALTLRQFDVGLFGAPPPSGASAEAIAGQINAPLRPPLQPDPSAWHPNSNFDDAAVQAAVRSRQSRAAVLSTMDNPGLPPLPQSGGTAAAAQSAQPSLRISQVLRDNAERAEMLARALSATVKDQIAQLAGRNEPEWRDQIEFLELVAATLDHLADAIAEARRAKTPEEREQKFSEAENWATSLAKAAKNFAERNYERVIDYGGYCTMTVLGTLLFTTLFGVPADEAMAAQLLLLGFGKLKG